MDGQPLWSEGWWERIAARVRELLPGADVRVDGLNYLCVMLDRVAHDGRRYCLNRSVRTPPSVYVSINSGTYHTRYISVDGVSPDAVAVAAVLTWLRLLAEKP